MSNTGTATAQADFLLTIALEAKASRDAAGTVHAGADAQLADFLAGNFRGLIDVVSGTTSTITPDGQQGAKPEMVARVEKGIMIGEAPGKGTGRYGTHKQPTTIPASEKQIAFINALIADIASDKARDIARAACDALIAEGKLTGGRGGGASKMIDSAKALITKCGSRKALTHQQSTTATKSTSKYPPLPEVADGYYATTGADGTTKFYRVVNHRNGKLYLNVQASDAWYDVEFRAYRTILTAIVVDPAAAAKRYANELGRCYLCNRPLTDDESRGFGTGPDCGGRR